MGRFIAAVYDRLTQASEAACLQQWRADLLRDLAGHVLEIGAGTGLNIAYYPRTLSRLVLSEPDPHMRRKLSRKARAQHWDQAEVLDASLEELPLPNDAFGAVVGTLVLCSVPRLDHAYLATMGLVGLADELVRQPVLPTTVVRDTAPSTP